jgi:Lon protease-like protein
MGSPILSLPTEVGIMALPNAVLFPKVLLPLYIFEPRFQKMLNLALEDHRIFAVSLATPSMKPHSVAGIGIIRACVDNADGTSNLVLQGLTRVRFTEYLQTKPYYIAKIELFATEVETGAVIDALVAKTIEYVEVIKSKGTEMPEWMADFMKNLNDPETLVDMISYGFVSDAQEKQAILETKNLKERFDRLLYHLKLLAEK